MSRMFIVRDGNQEWIGKDCPAFIKTYLMFGKIDFRFVLIPFKFEFDIIPVIHIPNYTAIDWYFCRIDRYVPSMYIR